MNHFYIKERIMYLHVLSLFRIITDYLKLKNTNQERVNKLPFTVIAKLNKTCKI